MAFGTFPSSFITRISTCAFETVSDRERKTIFPLLLKFCEVFCEELRSSSGARSWNSGLESEFYGGSLGYFDFCAICCGASEYSFTETHRVCSHSFLLSIPLHLTLFSGIIRMVKF